MSIPNKVYWLIYIFISSTLLLPMLVMGIMSPKALEPLLTTGGIIESLPAIVNLLSAVLSAFLALRLAIMARGFWFWGLYSIFCLFLVGEESAWGSESVLGWQIWDAGGLTKAGDIHNFLADLLALGIPTSVVYSGVIVIGLAAVFIYFKFPISKQTLPRTWLNRLTVMSLPHQFVLIGIILLLFGLVDLIQESFRLPYIPGQWSIEESFELLGSIALLFAVVVRILEPPQIDS